MAKLLNNRWFLFIVISLTWGSSFILVKKSLLGFSPYEIGAIRVAISGLLLGFIGLPAIFKMPRKTLFWVIVAGFFGNFLPMFLFPIAQQKVSSSLAGILDALFPMFVLAFGFLFFGIKSRWSQVLGAVIGFLGAASLIYFSEVNTDSSQFWYAMIVVLAGASYGINALLIKEKIPNLSSIKLTAAVFTFWAFPSLVILFFTNLFQNFEWNSERTEAMGYLGFLSIFGTAVAMSLYYKLIQNTSPVFASSVSYVLPIVAVIWGVLDGEKFTFWYLIGAVLIAIGIYLIREKKINPYLPPPK
ncbi:DMT family transporter [Gelidibacter pelagius]|uniref:EamA family transporter n=1 Tax=Gelidibacter pelagius TaxID=2819985 RepID=A0ABS3SSC7_9FLAO|nr:DMT family transporter [Gelidibacter pelagius]MBO3098610.1 EamA family transporter [Gelidibacter pelagius]